MRSSEVDIRLLGGFLVRDVSGEEARFESQKVRGLLAFLACRAGRPVSREHLAELLWPEADPDTGRHNLRQALYSLRQGLGGDRGRIAESGGTTQGVVFELAESDSLDVAEFQAALRRGFPGGREVVAADLADAVDLYRGDLLAGFYVRGGSAEFENWLVGEQERLRDAALAALRALVDHFAARGEYDQALVYGRRLIEIDPLSEEAHREVMRLYVLAGRRRRALGEFEELAELLQRELGVEPLPETRALYESILAERLPAPGPEPALARPPLGPFVPMVGRADALAALEESWQQAVETGARVALVDGEEGIGKTRLIRSFLDRITSRRRAVVVQSQLCGPEPPAAGQPLLQLARVLERLAEEDDPGPSEARRTATAETGREDAGSDAGPDVPVDERLSAAVRHTLLSTGPDRARPLILFLDDLHLAGGWAAERIGALVEQLGAEPLWVVATLEGGRLPPEHPLVGLAEGPRGDRVVLERLGEAAIAEIGRTLVGDEDHDAERLARHLGAISDGLPLAIVEHVNSLCDQGILAPASHSRWSLAKEPESDAAAEPELDAVIARRIDHLPTSTRRLLVLAAVIGQTFDVELLQRAAREHIGVVEIGIELMLERWLIRQHARHWSDDPRERDLVLWAQGARRGTFEFAHERIRRVAYDHVNPLRRRLLHREVADALAERHPLDEPGNAETVAHHYVAAGEWERAAPYQRLSLARAERLGDTDAAGAEIERLLRVLDRLARESPGDAARWDELREEALAARERLVLTSGDPG